MDMALNVKNILFSEPKPSGNFKKITISDSDGKKILIETEDRMFFMGDPKSDRYDSYSIPLVFRNGNQTVKTLNKILQTM